MTAPEYDAVHHFHQPENGYRFSADSIWLARFVDLSRAELAADFGAGCGVVGLSALGRGRAPARFFFVERQAALLECLRLNLALYQPRTGAALTALAADWRDLGPSDFGGLLDYVLVNPPYFPLAASRPSARPQRDEARREVHGGLTELAASLARLTRPGGRAALMLPFRRRAELLACLKEHGFSPLRVETVEGERGPDGDPEPRLVLVEAERSAGDIDPPT